MKVHLNGTEIEAGSYLEFFELLDQVDSTENVEVWIESPSESSLCLLKKQDYVILMYLSFPTDSGFVSASRSINSNSVKFTMANGQVDEYPLSWCIDQELAYKAVAYFYLNSGERSPHIKWQAT